MYGTFPRSLPPARAPQAGGFSLIEILVVVTLIGIAAGLSIPKINTITNQNKVQRAAQALQLEVQQAFAIAGRNRTPTKIQWVSSSLQLQITSLNGATVYRRAGLGAGSGYGFSASEVTVTPSTVIVFPSGLAGDTLVIALSRKGYTKTLRVSRSGMSRLQ